MKRITTRVTLNSGSPTDIIIPEGVSACRVTLGRAPGPPDTERYLFTVNDGDGAVYNIPVDRTYTFHGNWTGPATVGTAQLQEQGDQWTPPQPMRRAEFQLFIDSE